MKRGQKWAVGLGIVTVLLGAAWLALLWWLPSDEELTARLTAESKKQLGVEVTIGSARWALLPRPAVVVKGFRTGQPQPVVIGALTAHPDIRALLLERRLAFELIVVNDAVLPRNSVHAFRAEADATELDPGADPLIRRFEFRNLTWISYSGIPVAFDGEIDFDPYWRPRTVELRSAGTTAAFTMTLTREADADSWGARVHVGGGTAHGNLALKTASGGAMVLSGHLAPRGIEVESALRSFNRRSPVGGKGSGRTVVSAGGKSVRELARSLHTRTTFSVNSATILRFDLEKAISTKGKEHDGQTPLQELTGQMDTQNTDAGMRVTYSDLKARAGKYTAAGEATVYHRQIKANGILYLVEGAVGVPFSVSGPVDKPKASVSPGLFAGAAIGTAVLPGIGTAIGAGIGGALDQLFKRAPDAPAPGAPKKSSLPR